MTREMLATLAVAGVASMAMADDWVAKLTVDNQFNVYFGDSMGTDFAAGGGNSWPTTYTITANGRAATDYLYVSTASDQSVAQGFVGEFTNTTGGFTIKTGSNLWEVFPAGAYLNQIFGQTTPWTPSLMPTQSQVDAAIAYATTNNLWINTSGFQDWDNRVSGNITIWGHRPGIAADAQWIWHNKLGTGNPFSGGFNHDEFLVFRVAGVPAPSGLSALSFAGLLSLRRRRA